MIDLKKIVIVKPNFKKIGVLAITEEEHLELADDIKLYWAGKLSLDKFKEKYGFEYLDMILYGNVHEGLTSSVLQELIGYEDVMIDETKTCKSYICFCGKPYGLDYRKRILHSSPLSSWDCLMIYMNKPDYAIVFNLETMILP